MEQIKILLVEDEQIASMDLQNMVEDAGYTVTAATNTAEDALERLETESVDLVIMDIALPGDLDGIDATERINEEHGIPVVYLTAYSDEETIQRARKTRPAGFMVKPVTEADIRATIEMALNEGE